MPPSRLLLTLALAAAALAACTPATLRGPSSGVPGETRRPGIPRASGTVTPGTMQTKYVCRGHTITGWIAINYISDTEVCATAADINYRYNTAVIVPLSGVSVGATLEVCAEERVPANFSQVRLIPGDGRCPSEKPVSDPSVPTVREIRRDR